MAAPTAGPTSPAVSDSILSNRWTILFFSVLSMVAVANFQYGWTLFVTPLQKQFGVEQALIQVTFTVFVLLETWLVPFEGWLVDKFSYFPAFVVAALAPLIATACVLLLIRAPKVSTPASSSRVAPA